MRGLVKVFQKNIQDLKYTKKQRMKPLHYILIALLLIGCKSKKTTTERTYESDTLRSVSISYKSEPITSRIELHEVCDTITGELKPIQQSQKSGNNSYNVFSENNKLFLDLMTGSSERKTDTIYKTKYRDKIKEVEETRYRTPMWIWYVVIGLIALNLVQLKFGSILGIFKQLFRF